MAAATSSGSSQVAERKEQFTLYAELKPHLSIVQLTINIPKNSCKRDLMLKVSKSCIQLVKKIPSRQFNHTLDVHGLTFVPPSCHGMKSLGEEIHFRMQVMAPVDDRPKSVPQESCTAQLQVFENPHFHCFCNLCGQVVVQNVKFRRVLPLPSDNWHEMADTWFCHKHSDCGGVDSSTRLAPRQGDCLVADTHFILHQSSALVANIIFNENSGLVNCRRCHQRLGRRITGKNSEGSKASKDIDGLCFFIHCLEIPAAVHALSQLHIETTDRFGEQMAELLSSHSQRYNSFRFIVESRDVTSKKPVQPSLLLWVLDSHTLVCQYHQTLDENSVDKLNTVPVMKLMYTDCLRKQKLGLYSEWKKDLTVHHLELPLNVCHRLLEELIHSTLQLPQSLRVMNNFYVGSLPR